MRRALVLETTNLDTMAPRQGWRRLMQIWKIMSHEEQKAVRESVDTPVELKRTIEPIIKVDVDLLA